MMVTLKAPRLILMTNLVQVVILTFGGGEEPVFKVTPHNLVGIEKRMILNTMFAYTLYLIRTHLPLYA